MNKTQIRQFVMRYFEAEQCVIIDKHPAYVTVKLSPSADKELTYRPYYWNFVERTGITPETMTCTFIFDPDGYKSVQEGGGAVVGALAGASAPPAAPGAVAGGASLGPVAPAAPVAGGAPSPSPGTPEQAQRQPDSILGRYFGFVPTQVTARVPKDEVTFGSRRLQQIFAAVCNKGRFVHLYEQFQPEYKSAATVPYENWVQVNYKVELACDMKRNEIHSLGFHLGTGEIREHFHQLLQGKRLTPRLPAHVFIVPDKIALPRAVIYLEDYLEQKLRSYDHRWAEEAGLRLQDELDRILGYYETLIQNAEPDKKPEIEAQFLHRRLEIEWQYQPRIHISVINCGLFHVKMDTMPATDVFR